MKINKINENKWKDEKIIMKKEWSYVNKSNDGNGINKSMINNDTNINKNN